jgi:hypothetical protein
VINDRMPERHKRSAHLIGYDLASLDIGVSFGREGENHNA